MFLITCSSRLLKEKKYIIDVVFSEFLSVKYKLLIDEGCEGFLIKFDNGKKISISSEFLDSDNEKYLIESNLPQVTYTINQFLIEKDIPVLFGDSSIDISEFKVDCRLAVFDTCFFMLSRMEEVIIKDKDCHGRFSAKSSVAFKYDFLDRPIVDEYVEMLWNMCVYLDASLSRVKLKHKKFITCDLDWPFDPIRRSLKKTLLKSAADIVKRKNIISAFMNWKYFIFYILKIKQKDVYRDAIDWIMDTNEKLGNKVAFYFITLKTSHLDTNFDFLSDEIKELLYDIHMRGHEIGLHPGYNCFKDKKKFTDSFNILKEALKKTGINQKIIGGRMHFLRWDIMDTPLLYESCGCDYDSTLNFADISGFRCGTSKEFSMYSLKNREKLNLKQIPLINMECTVISDRYEGLGYSKQAFRRFLQFKNKTEKYHGIYTLLWHNSHLLTINDKNFYKELIQ